MREVVLYITASLDCFIADSDGGVDWLRGADDEDYGYGALIESIDTVIQGSHTYLSTFQLVDADPYPGLTNYVFTSRDDLPQLGDPTFVADDPVEFIRAIKKQPGGRIWLIGGGQLASTLLGAGLVDSIELFVQPVLLGDGIPLFTEDIRLMDLDLIDARAWPGGLAQLRYRVSTPLGA